MGLGVNDEVLRFLRQASHFAAQCRLNLSQGLNLPARGAMSVSASVITRCVTAYISHVSSILFAQILIWFLDYLS